jgi:hypothetical protein
MFFFFQVSFNKTVLRNSGSGAMSGTIFFFQKFSLDNSNTGGHHSLVTLLDRILSNYMQFSILVVISL